MVSSLIDNLLRHDQDQLGYNGTSKGYMFLRRLHYWKGLRPAICKYERQCKIYQYRIRQMVKYASLHFGVPEAPLQFISMDLIGEFYSRSSVGNSYALTVR